MEEEIIMAFTYMRKSDEMTKRERVEAAMNFQETDRVPLYDIIINDDIIEYFTGRIPPVGVEGEKLQCKAIGKMLDMTRMAGIGPSDKFAAEDEDGFITERNRWTSKGIRKRPFDDEDGAVEWLKKANGRLEKRLKAFDADKVRSGFINRFTKVQQWIGDDTVNLHGQSGTGLDVVRHQLGYDKFSYIDVDYPGLIQEYMELATQIELKNIHATADPKLSPCALTYGDIAFKGALMHSPDWLRKNFIPHIAKLNEAWHSYGIKCLFHSDGDVMEILQDLIDAKCDGFNPIETTAGISLKDIRDNFGNQIFLAGGIDISTLMSFGTPEEVRAECEMSVIDGGRGYFMGSTTELDPGSKLENVLSMVNVAWGEIPGRTVV